MRASKPVAHGLVSLEKQGQPSETGPTARGPAASGDAATAAQCAEARGTGADPRGAQQSGLCGAGNTGSAHKVARLWAVSGIAQHDVSDHAYAWRSA